jgi:hypothetical protein
MPRSREEPEAQDVVDRGRREACAPTCGSPTPTGPTGQSAWKGSWPSSPTPSGHRLTRCRLHHVPACPSLGEQAVQPRHPGAPSTSTPRNVTAASSDENGGGSAANPQIQPIHKQPGATATHRRRAVCHRRHRVLPAGHAGCVGGQGNASHRSGTRPQAGGRRHPTTPAWPGTGAQVPGHRGRDRNRPGNGMRCGWSASPSATQTSMLRPSPAAVTSNQDTQPVRARADPARP